MNPRRKHKGRALSVTIVHVALIIALIAVAWQIFVYKAPSSSRPVNSSMPVTIKTAPHGANNITGYVKDMTAEAFFRHDPISQKTSRIVGSSFDANERLHYKKNG